jgi:NADPH:quinone reductase-like Zn-dependent oxidoreductase
MAVRFHQFGGPEVVKIVDLPDPHPGPGQVRIAVRAAGVNTSDWKKRKGLMDGELPQTMGHEAAGVGDELGEGVADVAVGDRVFGFSAEGAAQAELAVLSHYAPIPPSLDFPGAAPLPAAIETATRALDQLGVGSDSTLLINGASGSVGSAAVQLAVVRGARVIGTASPANPGRADLPARRDRGGAPRQRGRLRAREARAGGRLSYMRVQVMHADRTTAAR